MIIYLQHVVMWNRCVHWYYTCSNLGAHITMASATLRKILSSPTMFANSDACNLSSTTCPGFARLSCLYKHPRNNQYYEMLSRFMHLNYVWNSTWRWNWSGYAYLNRPFLDTLVQFFQGMNTTSVYVCHSCNRIRKNKSQCLHRKQCFFSVIIV